VSPIDGLGGVSPLNEAGALAATDPTAARLEALRHAPDDVARRAAAKEVQVLFLTQLIRAMRATVPQNDFLPASPSRTLYDGVFDRSVAEAMAERDPLGLVRDLGEAPGLKIPGQQADKAVGIQKAGEP
jgi:Rod binding domain-containing protein